MHRSMHKHNVPDPVCTRNRVMTPVQNIYGITVDAPARNYKEYHAQKSHYEKELANQLFLIYSTMSAASSKPACR